MCQLHRPGRGVRDLIGPDGSAQMRIRPLCSDPCRGELLADRAALGRAAHEQPPRAAHGQGCSRAAHGQSCSRAELLSDRPFGPLRAVYRTCPCSAARNGHPVRGQRQMRTASVPVRPRPIAPPALGEIRNGQRPWRAARALDPACGCLLGDRVQAPSGEEGKFLASPAGQGASGGVGEQVAGQVVRDEVGHPPSEEWPPNRGSAMPRLAAH